MNLIYSYLILKGIHFVIETKNWLTLFDTIWYLNCEKNVASNFLNTIFNSNNSPKLTTFKYFAKFHRNSQFFSSDLHERGGVVTPFKGVKNDLIAELKLSHNIGGISKLKQEQQKIQAAQEREKYKRFLAKFTMENFLEKVSNLTFVIFCFSF